MVPTHAPNSRRSDVNTPDQLNDNWTQPFRKASASRTNRKTSLLTLALCAFLIPTSLSIQSQADQGSTKSVDSSAVASSKNESAQSVSTSSETTPSQPATPDAPASASPSQPLSQLNPSSEPAFAEPKTDAQPADNSNAAANVAVSPAPSLSPVTKLAPIPESVTAKPTPKVEAQPKFRIRAVFSGQTRQAQIAVTPKMTVGQALAAMGISLAALDRVVPDASALARDGMSVHIQRVSALTEKRRTSIPAAELRYQPTTKIKAGVKQTIQQAKPGAVEITERVWKVDGKVTKRQFISRHIAVAPQPKIVALGVKSHLMPNSVRPHRRYARALSYRGGTPRDRMLAPANPNSFVAVKSLTVVSTGYSAGPAGGAVGNWTATGVRCTYGAVAVDPRLIPLGSKLYIEGYGYGFACDTGGAIKGAHIDLAFDSPRAAMRHGRKRVKVWILGQ
jgi:3D (Asp-Asp-Asp) domain-containing protein